MLKYLSKSLKISIFKDYSVIKGDMTINNHPNTVSLINSVFVLHVRKFSFYECRTFYLTVH